jgi:predicted phage-related endonuclease
MKILENMVQGSDSWHQLRQERFTASEAAAVFGPHKYMSRTDLLKLKHTGVQPHLQCRP